MNYFKGDVVEIITAKYKCFSDITDINELYQIRSGMKLPQFVGQRFRVAYTTNNGDVAWRGGYGSDFIEKENIILYKRPLINHIKYLQKLIFDAK